MRQELLSYTSDLVIALLPDDSWGYYFADNARHTVFWVHRIRISTIVGSCSRSVSTDEHLSPSSFVTVYFTALLTLATWQIS